MVGVFENLECLADMFGNMGCLPDEWSMDVSEIKDVFDSAGTFIRMCGVIVLLVSISELISFVLSFISSTV